MPSVRVTNAPGSMFVVRALCTALWILGSATCVWAGPSRNGATQPASLQEAIAPDGLYAVIETTLGTIACALEFEKTPVTVGSFVGLAEGQIEFRDPRTQEWVKRPFYDGLKFHRVVKDFVVQSGDPLGDGTGGPGYVFIDEFRPDLKHNGPGVLSMANSGPGTNGSQFFITLARQPHLDGRHTVFGHTVFGLDVLERMANQPVTGPQHTTPVTDIVMTKVRIVRHGEVAMNFNAVDAFSQQNEIIAQREVERRTTAAAFRADLDREMANAAASASGLRYVVQRPGQGEPPATGDVVTVHYVGYLDDGTKFDSSYDREMPFKFPVGTGRVIKGWDELLLTMRAGEKRRAIVPPDLAYGARGAKRFGIPPNATLIFDVELVEIAHP
jgi:peptidyl-prolyl cis-trans isomerase A (cyclophilin A)